MTYNPVFAGYAAVNFETEEIEDDIINCYVSFDVVDPDGQKLNGDHKVAVRAYKYDIDSIYDKVEKHVVHWAKKDYLLNRKIVLI
jgi:hypothetical protein